MGGFAPRFTKDFEGIDLPRSPSVSLAEANRQPAFLRSSLDSNKGLTWAGDDTLNGPRNTALRPYYRLIQGLDFCVGALLQELETRSLSRNTILVFSSDNGYFHGEHGFSGKWLMHEESIRTPMIIFDPRAPSPAPGRVCDAMVLNIDIAPTLLELAGQSIPSTMQGQSLVPLLANPGHPFRGHFFYEHLYDPGPARHIESSEGVRTHDWKYIVYPSQSGPGREELYHLSLDPCEMKNLASEPGSHDRLQQMRDQHRDYTTNLK